MYNLFQIRTGFGGDQFMSGGDQTSPVFPNLSVRLLCCKAHVRAHKLAIKACS
jgi:hypothetical protein